MGDPKILSGVSLKDLDLGLTRRRPFQFDRALPDGTKATIKVEIRVLHPNELTRCFLSAEQYIRDSDKEKIATAIYDEMRENARHYELLAQALCVADCREPDVVAGRAHPPAWAGPHELRAKLYENEVSLLLAAYKDFEATTSPRLYELTATQQTAFLEKLVEEADEDPLVLLAPRTQRHFLRCMAAEVLIARTARSSLTSPDGSPDDDETSEPGANAPPVVDSAPIP